MFTYLLVLCKGSLPWRFIITALFESRRPRFEPVLQGGNSSNFLSDSGLDERNIQCRHVQWSDVDLAVPHSPLKSCWRTTPHHAPPRLKPRRCRAFPPHPTTGVWGHWELGGGRLVIGRESVNRGIASALRNGRPESVSRGSESNWPGPPKFAAFCVPLDPAEVLAQSVKCRSFVYFHSRINYYMSSRRCHFYIVFFPSRVFSLFAFSDSHYY